MVTDDEREWLTRKPARLPYLIRIITGPKLDPCFLNLMLNAPAFKDYCSEVKTDGMSQSNINAQKLADYGVNWCPIVEQYEIVRRVEALFTLADKIEACVQAATACVEKISKAILAKAFRGELVPTEAELARRESRPYERASTLLDRIPALGAVDSDYKAARLSKNRASAARKPNPAKRKSKSGSRAKP